MKYALCLTGQIRSHNLVCESVKKNFLDLYDMDIFCHIWHKNDHSPQKSFYSGIVHSQYHTEKIHKVIDFYKPLSFKYEEPYIPENPKSMMCSFMKSNNLKREYEENNGIKYDVVIKSRFDIFFSRPFVIEDVEDKTIYLINRPGGCGGYNDWVCYGNSETMNTYMETFETYKDTDRIRQKCPEGIFKQHLDNNGISVKYIDRVFSIMREDGNLVG
jgi:hypothetical protein